MSKALFLGFPFHGHTNPTLELVKELVARGEQVFYYSEEPFREKIENAGADYRPYKTEGFSENTGSKMSFADGVEEWLSTFSFIVGYGQAVIGNMLQEIQSENFDYIIHDSCAYWGKQIASALKIPGICSISTLVFDERMMETESDLFLKSVLRITTEALLKKYGFDKASSIREFMSYYLKTTFKKKFDINDLILPREELYIVYTSRMFQIHSEYFDERFIFIGPSILRPEKKVEFTLQALTDKPLIYISLGTVFNQRVDFYQKCIAAFKDSHFQVAMSVGDNIDIRELGIIPANFMVGNYLPQLEILKFASVFISHAGANSCNESIYYHVPLVLLPQGGDQLLTAERVAELGAGLYMRNPDFSPGELRQVTEMVIANQTYRDKAVEIAESFKTAGGSGRACEAIFSFKTARGIQ